VMEFFNLSFKLADSLDQLFICRLLTQNNLLRPSVFSIPSYE
jgi:hypothetical protein